MTFHEISKKMLLANFRRYALFFYCNVFSVALFYCFAAIFTNSTFMNSKIVDSMISSNIIAPSVFVGIFLLLFVPYSYQAFLKNRKREYGIFMALGMSHAEVLQNMLFESGVVAGLALGIGLFLGTAVSALFSCILCQMLGISALQWSLNLDSYRVTALFFGLTVLLIWAVNIFGFFRAQLIDWMKGKFRAEKAGRPSPILLAAGIILIAVSVLPMGGSGKSNVGSILLASLAGTFAGLWLIFANAGSVWVLLTRRIPSFGKSHLVEISFIRQHLRSQRRIGMAAVGLIGFSVFFAGLCAAAYPSFTKNAETYSHYDLLYCQTEGKNQVNDASIESLLNRNGVTVRSEKQIPYLRDAAFSLLAVSEVNREFSCDYRVPRGEFLTVFPYDLNDGYEHEMLPPKSLSFPNGKETIRLKSAGSSVRILFNPNPALAERILILSDSDFHRLASQSDRFFSGTMKLYSFADWRSSGNGVAAVQNYLWQQNKVEKIEQIDYAASSRIETYQTAQRSFDFFLFLMSFVILLFCVSADVMIVFRIQSEAEKEGRMLFGLHRIGITSQETAKIIFYKNIAYFVPQVVLGILLGAVYCGMLNSIGEFRWAGVFVSLLFGLFLLALQLVILVKYSGKEQVRFCLHASKTHLFGGEAFRTNA